ncbi:hypothetical protein L2D14_01580 [Thalassospiraceae bacterium LMO-JJ14]|nr:hypothetical protein L2D14_01580 [Thalassospiraceae bacterium LMO-JJ14]
MTDDQSNDENERKRRVRAKWRQRLAVLTVMGIAVWWVTTMPMTFYNPYCGAGNEGWRGEHYGTHLSTYYRETLTRALANSGVPFFEIGDRVLVPLVHPGLSDSRNSRVERFFDIVFNDTDRSWDSTHWKVAYNALSNFKKKHPNSEISKMYVTWDTQLGSGERGSYLDKDVRFCELTKRIVDPSLE